MAVIDDLADDFRRRLAEIEQEREKIESVLQVLEEGRPRTRKAKPKPAPKRKFKPKPLAERKPPAEDGGNGGNGSDEPS